MSDKNEVVVRDEWAMILGGGPGLILAAETTFDQWDDLGKKLRYIEQYIQFKLGDWLNHGATAFGEKYSQVLEETDYTKRTLEDFAWVCGKIPMDSRNPHVSFGHHRVVAKLDEFQQIEELAYAQNNELTVEDFRQHIKNKYGKTPESSGLPKEDEPKNIIEQILALVRERKVSAIPDKKDIAWMSSTITSVEKLCVRITGE